MLQYYQYTTTTAAAAVAATTDNNSQGTYRVVKKMFAFFNLLNGMPTYLLTNINNN